MERAGTYELVVELKEWVEGGAAADHADGAVEDEGEDESASHEEPVDEGDTAAAAAAAGLEREAGVGGGVWRRVGRGPYM